MSKSTFSTEQVLGSIFDNAFSLIVAAVLFSAGIGLTGFSTFTVSSLSSYIALGNLVQVFIAGLLVAAALAIAYSRKPLKASVAGLVAETKPLAVAATLWTLGMLFVGIGNTQGFTPVGIISSLVGYALLLASLILSGTLGVHIASTSTV